MRDETSTPKQRRRIWISADAITTAADVAGAGAVTAGAWMISTPLGLVVGGALTMFLSWMAAR